MKKLYVILLCILPSFKLWGFNPNSDFSLEFLKEFSPGQSIESLLKKENKNSQLIEDTGEIKTYRFIQIKKNYKLVFYTQSKKDQITQLFLKLPQYFSHDFLLKDLQKKWGKQNKFFNHDKSSLYFWKNISEFNLIYHGSCSLTCFPISIELTLKEDLESTFYKKYNQAINF